MSKIYLNKKSIVVCFYMVFGMFYAQNPIEVIYKKSLKDKGPVSSFIFKDDVAYLSKNNTKNLIYIDYQMGAVVTIIKDKNNYYKNVEDFTSLPQPTYLDDPEKIVGHICKKAVFKAFSNTIEVWYTEKSKAKGSPLKNYLPKNGLVLKIKVNGNLYLIASKINKLSKKTKLFYPKENFIEVTKSELRELQIKSKYETLIVFNKEQINFDTELPKVLLNESNKTYRCSKGTIILKKVKLPKIVKKGAFTFVKLTNWSNGDAYDRTGSVFTISGKKAETILNGIKKGLEELPVFKGKDKREYQGIVSTENYETPVELMRFFTSFGVSHFNKLREINNYKWRDSVVYKQEITSLVPTDEEEIWIGVFIGNYDKGGHKVSLELNFYPPEESEKLKERYIKPLFSTVNILEASNQNYGRIFKTDTLTTTFTVPKNIENLKLLYTATGHGGWDRGDEFIQRVNKVFIDGKLIFNEAPWRTDCATYRLSNPSSGIFFNGLSSSDLSRSNWCPATLTPPKFIPLKFLKSRKHTIQIVIEQGDDKGNSFNHWGVSGVLTGDINSIK